MRYLRKSAGHLATRVDRVVANPDLYQRVIRLGSVHATAKRKVFNVACALLDFDTVREMIAAGHKINRTLKAVGRDSNSEVQS